MAHLIYLSISFAKIGLKCTESASNVQIYFWLDSNVLCTFEADFLSQIGLKCTGFGLKCTDLSISVHLRPNLSEPNQTAVHLRPIF